MVNLIMVIPQGDPGSIDIRPPAPHGLKDAVGPHLEVDHVLVQLDSHEFLEMKPETLALMYGAPAFAALQNALRARGY